MGKMTLLDKEENIIDLRERREGKSLGKIPVINSLLLATSFIGNLKVAILIETKKGRKK